MNEHAQPLPPAVAGSEGYRKLLTAVERDEAQWPNFHNYRGKLDWAVNRALHYSEKTGLAPETLLNAWEERRDYWYMNYYQENNQPEIKGDKVAIFETTEELLKSVGEAGFRCPACEGISKSPYNCTAGTIKDGKPCDWKAYGLFGCMGKGASVFVKEKLCGETFFKPIAWESLEPEYIAP